jgi:ribose transport system substrate-binding protein
MTDRWLPGQLGAKLVSKGTTRREVLIKGSTLAVSMSGIGAFLEACGGNSGGGGGGAASSSGSVKGKTIGYVTFGNQFEFQVALVKTITKAAAAKGIKLQTVDGKADPNLQTTELESAISKQPDGILVDPVDAKLMIAGIAKANQANLPVFVLENMPPSGKIEAFVTNGDLEAGQIGADTLGKLINGTGRVLECRGAVGSANADARFKGFNDQMAKNFPNVKVDTLKTEWVADKALTLVLDAFTRDPNVAGIWSHNDEMIRGVVGALTQIHRTAPVGAPGHIPIVGIDGTKLALERIRNGTQDATVFSDAATMGNDIVNNIAAYYEKTSYPKNVVVPVSIITKDKAADPNLWGNQ